MQSMQELMNDYTVAIDLEGFDAWLPAGAEVVRTAIGCDAAVLHLLVRSPVTIDEGIPPLTQRRRYLVYAHGELFEHRGEHGGGQEYVTEFYREGTRFHLFRDLSDTTVNPGM